MEVSYFKDDIWLKIIVENSIDNRYLEFGVLFIFCN